MKISLITIIIFAIIVGIALHLLTKKPAMPMQIAQAKTSPVFPSVYSPKLRINKQDTQGLAG